MKSMTNGDWALCGLLSLLFGTTFFSTEIALGSMSPLTIVATRMTMAATVLWLIVWRLGLERPKGFAIWWRLGVMGLINNALPLSLIAWPQVHITSGVAGILDATTPLFALVFAHVMTADERLTWRKALGVTIGFCGVILMIGSDALAGFDWRSVGQLVLLSASMLYALASIWGKRLRGLHPIMAATGTLTMAAMFMIPVALIVDGPTFDAAAVQCGTRPPGPFPAVLGRCRHTLFQDAEPRRRHQSAAGDLPDTDRSRDRRHADPG